MPKGGASALYRWRTLISPARERFVFEINKITASLNFFPLRLDFLEIFKKHRFFSAMPPKKRPTTRKTAEPSTSNMFRTIPAISKVGNAVRNMSKIIFQIFDEVATAQDNAAGILFTEALTNIVQKAGEMFPGHSYNQMHKIFIGKSENQFTDMVTRQVKVEWAAR